MEQVNNDILRIFEEFKKCSSRKIMSYIKFQQQRWNVDKVLEGMRYSINKTPASLNYDSYYYTLKYNISLKEAEERIQEFKSKKATSLKGFIARHGEIQGKILFEEFQKTSATAINKVREKFKIEYGDDWRVEFDAHRKERSKFCKEFYLKNGDSEEVAIKKAYEFNLKHCGGRRQFYIDKGYSEDEIDTILEKIAKKRSENSSRSIKNYKKKYGNDWLIEFRNSQNQYRKRMEGWGYWVPLENLDDFVRYKRNVDSFTEQSILESPELFKLRSKENHVDHIYSKKQGFIDDIDPQIIGSIVNLRILSNSENCSKKAKCHITRDELINKFTQHENSKNS